MHAGCYARYSSDLQRETSIDDQISVARQYAERQSWRLLDNHVYSDAGKSGGSIEGRPGIQALLKAAGYPNGFETSLSYGTAQRAYLPNPGNTAIQIQKDLERIGIRARLDQREWSSYIAATQNGEHEMAILGWMADINDADNFLYILCDKDSPKHPPVSSN